MSETVVFGRLGAERRMDLDWVRIGPFGLTVFYHIAAFYSPISRMEDSPRAQDGIKPPGSTSPWRLQLASWSAPE